MNKTYEVAIIGAGAAGLMCASIVAQSGRKVVLLDHNRVCGKKIMISGGGRCNFTNLNMGFENYLSSNPHFFKSALTNYTAQDFIYFIEKNKIKYFDKGQGQLFCKNSAQDILNLLINECKKSNVHFELGCKNIAISSKNNKYYIQNSDFRLSADKLVIASGGLSYSKIGATNLGHIIAKQFGHKIIPTRPALVPLKFGAFATLSGISIDATVKVNKYLVREEILFTHKGLSGPAILKASCFWKKGDKLTINWLPDVKIDDLLLSAQNSKKNITVFKLLREHLPKKFVSFILNFHHINNEEAKILEMANKVLINLTKSISNFQFVPTATEGFDKAEVTLGGVDTFHISSKTMESSLQQGIYFIGEVLDVTGLLGGYNFQWAWSSAVAAATSLKS